MSRFTFYKQQDAMQCGIASLAMICHYHGVKYSLSELNKRCGSTIEGVSVQSISSTASNIGLESFAGLMDLNSLRKTVLPCILHWNQNHFVVLYKTIDVPLKSERVL
jgi:ATP-binding cassette subfamily B protein